MTTCDKCGREVPPNNDATVIESFAFGNPFTILMNQSRHFLPVIENGVVVCEGSPSRAQYIPDQPRDVRGYAYDSELEAKWQYGYAMAQIKAELVVNSVRGYSPIFWPRYKYRIDNRANHSHRWLAHLIHRIRFTFHRRQL